MRTQENNLVANRKRVLFISTNLGGGGAERVAVSLLEHLDRKRFDPILVLFENTLDYTIPEDVPIFYLHKKGWYDFPRLVWELARVYRKWKPEVALSFLSYTNIIAVLAKILSRVKFKLLISEHGLPSLSPSRNTGLISLLFGKWIPRWLYPYADKVICVSQGVADDVRSLYRISLDKIGIIYNPIDIKTISVLSHENVDHPWFSEKQPIIISVGRLTAVKGYPYLLRAFAHIVTDFPCRLMILGKGEEEEALKALAMNLGIEDKVAFLGFQNNPFKYMARSSLFVLPSLSEGFSMVITEAMSCGIPIISTNCAGPLEIITPNVNGLLVPKADEKALTAAIIKLLTDRNLATSLAQAGRKRAEDFSIEKVIKEYEQLFD